MAPLLLPSFTTTRATTARIIPLSPRPDLDNRHRRVHPTKINFGPPRRIIIILNKGGVPLKMVSASDLLGARGLSAQDESKDIEAHVRA